MSERGRQPATGTAAPLTRHSRGRSLLHRRPGGRELLHRPPRRRRPRADRRPGRRAGADHRGGRDARDRGRGDPAHPLPLRPHRRGGAGGARRPGRRSTARRSRCRCSPTSCPTSPGRASARSRATTPTTRSAGASTCRWRASRSTSSSRPGHSPGHVTYAIPDQGALFSGDVLFKGSVGRTDLPGGDWGTLLESIRGLVDGYPEETVVYPGHMGVTTLGAERATEPVPRRARRAR